MHPQPPLSRLPVPPAALAAVSAALLLPACLSSGDTTTGESQPILQGTAREAPGEDDSLGYFLTEFDAGLRAWSNLRLTAESDRERRTLRVLERDLEERSLERQTDLVRELEGGPPRNRAICAAALGFTGDPAVQSPLLAALHDPDGEVVNNALLGVGILALPDTPIGPLCDLLLADPEPWTRNNAAFALHRLAAAGAEGEEMVACSRRALVDTEPGVRAQSATVLGILGDAEALLALGDLLFDEVDLVRAAAATAVSRIGRVEPSSKGVAARLLVEALGRSEGGERRWCLRQLAALANQDLGEETGAWRTWANRLP